VYLDGRLGWAGSSRGDFHEYVPHIHDRDGHAVAGGCRLATGSNGTTVGDPAITFDSLVSAIRAGNAYVNVHTSTPGCTAGDPGCNPGGEIRGQIQAQ